MAKNQFAQKHFHDEDAARVWFETARWPDGPICPNCGSLKHYATKKTGRYRCGEPECRKDFTVQTKSVMERSHAPLTHWAWRSTMAAIGKKGFSAHQLHRQLGCQYNTAWFLHHRVMEAMRRGGLEPLLGQGGKIVEADETYFGWVPEAKRPTKTTTGRAFTKGGRTGPSGKRAIVALVERGGDVRSFHVAVADQAAVENHYRKGQRARETDYIPMKAASIIGLANTSPRTKPSNIRAANMPVATCIPTRLKDIFRSSSAE